MRNVLYLVAGGVIALFLFSCQRELSFASGSQAEGALQKDANFNCLPLTVGGNYVAGKKLNDSNFLQVQVHITQNGPYSISTDTTNGYYFHASGTFNDTGLVIIKLPGSGTPAIDQLDHFIVSFGTSFCDASVNVASASSLAVFTLQGSPNACMNDTLYGSFVTGGTLDTSNKIKISVNVTRTGSYSLSTIIANGYSFSGSGTFTSTGIQTVTLTASGSPVKQQTDVFTVTAGTSN